MVPPASSWPKFPGHPDRRNFRWYHRPVRILVIEDNSDAREGLAALLRMWGHEVLEAATGTEGIELAVKHAPAVVLLDIVLPDIDGYDVARQLRRKLGKRIRLLALSGYGEPQDRARSSEAGFDVHIVKPIDPSDLERLFREEA
jgi:two-component system, sensor histidine kinase